MSVGFTSIKALREDAREYLERSVGIAFRKYDSGTLGKRIKRSLN